MSKIIYRWRWKQPRTVIPLNVGWRDVGTWDQIWENATKDEDNNYTQGKVIIEECSDSYFRSDERLIAGVGIKDLIVIETNDAVLLLNKKLCQKIKVIVDLLKQKNLSKVLNTKNL